MARQTAAVEADFDRIALLPPRKFNHNSYYHGFLAAHLPAKIGEALDLGCGLGDFTRILAARARRVIGIDVSRNMIAAARHRSDAFPNIEYVQADLMHWDWPVERFDAVVSIATLHHLPMEEMLHRMSAALSPGGVLAVLDLCRTVTLTERILGPWAFGWSALLHTVRTGRPFGTAEERRVWDEHARTDRYLSMAELRKIAGPILPGAAIRRHLFWRYSLIWRKPE
jgi:ubiquinone/menaquinone biosynthesis C-methylase UbiE